MLFYKETAFGFGFYSGFTSREYHIVCVDFIVALRRTKGRGRRTLRSPPSPSSGLHLIHPGVSAAAGHICCRGGQGYRQLYSGADRLSPLRRGVWVLCVRAEIVRVSVDFAGLEAFVFHYWMEKRRCSDGLVVSFFGLPLTAKWYQFRWMQAHFINVAECKNIEKMRSYSLYCKETGIPYSLSY